jgi:hypothetical protein
MSLPEDELRRLEWRKAKRSISNGACVEVASVTESIIIRDSMDPHGPVLRYPDSAWLRFLGRTRRGEFDRVF